jgi:2-C-methyl-D-erythritol 4-phosphate cytidylyltransferase
MKNVAIIAAGGKGSRFGGVVSKQLLHLKGRALVAHSVVPFEREAQIAEIILVYPQDEPEKSYADVITAEGFRKVRLIAGGESRFDSVRHGFLSIDRADVVLIHDAARPLVSKQLVSSVLRAAADKGAAIPLLPVRETVKRLGQDNEVETIPREALYVAQTPQGFRYDILKAAYDQVASSYAAPSWTDESMLVEVMGVPVASVIGERRNIKITDTEDLRLAEYYYAERA